MRNLLAASVLVASLTYAPTLFAQTPSELVCEDLVIPVVGVPDAVPLSFIIPMDDLVKQCRSATNAPLTLVTPTQGITVAPAPNSSQSFSFTVQDSYGHQASANLIVTRDSTQG